MLPSYRNVMAGHRRRYRFVIEESFTMETLPMARLAEYIADIADLLGEKSDVHFVRLESGSLALVQDVEHEAYPKVRSRVHNVKRGEGEAEARRAYESINRKLAADNGSGALIEDADESVPNAAPARVLDFPGRKKQVDLEYGPITQAGTLQGTVWMVGGDSEPVPVHIKDNDVVHVCRAKKPIAQALGKHLYGQSVRVAGNGRWLRDAAGTWTMRSFQIASFSLLNDDPVSIVIARLREIPGAWKDRDDTINTLSDLRHAED